MTGYTIAFIGLGLVLALFWYRKSLADLATLPAFHVKLTSVKTDFEYRKLKYGKSKRQYILYAEPQGNVKIRNEVIIYFHGGGWQFGSPEMFLPVAQLFTEWGFPVVLVSHRRLPFNTFKAMREDISAAAEKAWKTFNAQGHGNKDIIIGGMSSGGHLAANLFFNTEKLRALNFPAEKMTRAFLQSAPLELSRMIWSPTVFNLCGPRKGKLFFDANPINFLQKREKRPLYLIHSRGDGIVQHACTRSFYDKLQQSEHPDVIFKDIDSGGHMSVMSWVYQDDEKRKWLKDWLLRE